MCNSDGNWSIQATDISTCIPITCQAPEMTTSPMLSWNISYKIFYQSEFSPATTSFILICQEDYHFVNQIDNFTALCGFDG
jgi:hypothetical protein